MSEPREGQEVLEDIKRFLAPYLIGRVLDELWERGLLGAAPADWPVERRAALLDELLHVIWRTEDSE